MHLLTGFIQKSFGIYYYFLDSKWSEEYYVDFPMIQVSIY